MAQVVRACGQLPHHHQVKVVKCVDKSHKMGSESHGQRQTTCFLWKEGVKLLFIIGYLQVLARKHLRAVFSWVRSFSSGKETAQEAVCELYRNTGKEWFHMVIWRLSRSWQQCIDVEVACG
jgi:hypothetical protein